MSRSTVSLGRIHFIAWLLGGLFVAGLYGQSRVQLWNRQATLALARESNRFYIEQDISARRGAILSADGQPLAEDWDSGELRVSANKVPMSSAFFMDLGMAAGIPPSEIASQCLARRGSTHSGVVWRKPISPTQVQSVEQVRAKWRADGVSVARGDQRVYRMGALSSGILGRTANGSGIAGLELGLNDTLAGKKGHIAGIIDRNGAFLPTKGYAERTDPVHGQKVVLTIDSAIQRAAALAVRKAVEKEDAENGVAIVIDPKTGDILAMANWPSFDPDANFRLPNKKNAPSADLNPALMIVLEPGSTFKVLTLAEGLNRGAINLNTTVNCPGSMLVGRRRISCDHHDGARAHGTVNPELAIAKSCNVSAATWALRIGYPDFVDFLDRLGVLEEPDLGLPTVARGLFRKDEPAKQLQLATLGFGQSLGCVPITLAGAFAMIGNDGIRMKLRLVKQIGDKEVPIEEARRVVSSEAAHETLKVMESVFENPRGTGHKLKINGYILAGKTGTAEKVGAKSSGYVSNFVGFVPARDPRALVLVMVNNPRKAYYGAAVAGPAFVDIAKALIDRYKIPTESARQRLADVPIQGGI